MFDYCTISEINAFMIPFIIVFFLSILITIRMIFYGCAKCCCNSKKKIDLPDKDQKIVEDDEEEDAI